MCGDNLKQTKPAPTSDVQPQSCHLPTIALQKPRLTPAPAGHLLVLGGKGVQGGGKLTHLSRPVCGSEILVLSQGYWIPKAEASMC